MSGKPALPAEVTAQPRSEDSIWEGCTAPLPPASTRAFPLNAPVPLSVGVTHLILSQSAFLPLLVGR